ncbi:A disintegrin and metalloproteinase with thrombospondin motifs 20, partial [Frankliniella fusca]
PAILGRCTPDTVSRNRLRDRSRNTVTLRRACVHLPRPAALASMHDLRFTRFSQGAAAPWTPARLFSLCNQFSYFYAKGPSPEPLLRRAKQTKFLPQGSHLDRLQ